MDRGEIGTGGMVSIDFLSRPSIMIFSMIVKFSRNFVGSSSVDWELASSDCYKFGCL